MASNYPTSLDTITELPEPTSSTTIDDASAPHATVHTNLSQAVRSVQAKVGIGSDTAADDAPAGGLLVHTGSGTTEWLNRSPSDLTPDAPAVEATSAHTLTATDHALVYRATASALAVTIPTDSSEDLPDGFWCAFWAEGASGITSVTTGITTPGSPNTSVAQGQLIVYMKTASADTWLIIGGTS